MAPLRPAAALPRRLALSLCALLPPLAVLWWMARPLGAFVEDDALISMRYARRLLDGEGLTWTAGEVVEGYSNLLWVLSTAAVGALGVELILATRILGVACIVGCLWALLRIAPTAARVAGESRSWPGALAACGAGLLLCASGPIALWSIAGLEQPMVAALLLASAAIAARLLMGNGMGNDRQQLGERACSRDAVALGASLSLLVWTRPDSPLFVALFAAALATAGPGDRDARLRLAARVTMLPLSAWIAQLIFRLAYYGDTLPNPAYLKAGFAPARFGGGVEYLRLGVRYLWPLLLLSAVAAVDGLRDRSRRPWTALLVACVAVWSLYVAAIGGDHFPGHRHLVPVVALCAALVAASAATLGGRTGRPWALPLVGVLTVATSYGHARLQQRDPDYRMGIRARWQWDGKALGEMFAAGFGAQQPLWAVTAAGCLPYFSGLPALDMLGLNDRHIARRPPDPSMPLAHDHGDGTYVLDRKPDLITFGLPVGGPPIYLSGKQMGRDPRFARDYRPVQFRTLSPHIVQSMTYVRLEGRAGMRRDEGGLHYPAYLLSSAVGQPLEGGRIGAVLRAGARASTVELSLPPGVHRITTVPENPLLSIAVQAVRGEVRVTQGPQPRLQVGPGARLKIALRAAGLDTLLEALVVEPAPGAGDAQAAPPLSAGASSVLRPAAADGRARRPVFLLDFERGLSGAQPSGGAMVVTDAAVRGQQPVVGARGRFLNSFTAALGDRATGRLLTGPIAVERGDQLHVRIGGGRARAFHSHVGLAILVDGVRRQVLTGDDREQLLARAVDLSSYAGSSIRIEVFDQARGPWGHVLVDELAVLR